MEIFSPEKPRLSFIILKSLLQPLPSEKKRASGKSINLWFTTQTMTESLKHHSVWTMGKKNINCWS